MRVLSSFFPHRHPPSPSILWGVTMQCAELQDCTLVLAGNDMRQRGEGHVGNASQQFSSAVPPSVLVFLLVSTLAMIGVSCLRPGWAAASLIHVLAVTARGLAFLIPPCWLRLRPLDAWRRCVGASFAGLMG